MSFVVNGVMTRGTLTQTKASAAETVSSTHLAFDGGQVGSVVMQVVVTAVSGTSPLLTVNLQGSYDDATWVTIGSLGATAFAVGNGAAPTGISANGTYYGVFPAFQFLRTTSTIAGTTPSFTYSVNLIGNMG